MSIWIPERIKEDTDIILEEMTKQDKEQRQIYGLKAQKFKDQREKMQEQNDNVVSAIIKSIEKVQEERDGNSVSTPSSSSGHKRKESATFARTRGIMRLNAPSRKQNIQRANIPEDPSTPGNETWLERKQNSNCYHCGEKGHWGRTVPHQGHSSI